MMTLEQTLQKTIDDRSAGAFHNVRPDQLLLALAAQGFGIFRVGDCDRVDPTITDRFSAEDGAYYRWRLSTRLWTPTRPDHTFLIPAEHSYEHRLHVTSTDWLPRVPGEICGIFGRRLAQTMLPELDITPLKHAPRPEDPPA